MRPPTCVLPAGYGGERMKDSQTSIRALVRVLASAQACQDVKLILSIPMSSTY